MLTGQVTLDAVYRLNICFIMSPSLHLKLKQSCIERIISLLLATMKGDSIKQVPLMFLIYISNKMISTTNSWCQNSPAVFTCVYNIFLIFQSSVSHAPSEWIIICWFNAQETFLIIIKFENSCFIFLWKPWNIF